MFLKMCDQSSLLSSICLLCVHSIDWTFYSKVDANAKSTICSMCRLEIHVTKMQKKQKQAAVVSLPGVTAAAIWGYCSKLQVLAYSQLIA